MSHTFKSKCDCHVRCEGCHWWEEAEDLPWDFGFIFDEEQSENKTGVGICHDKLPSLDVHNSACATFIFHYTPYWWYCPRAKKRVEPKKDKRLMEGQKDGS